MSGQGVGEKAEVKRRRGGMRRVDGDECRVHVVVT
jgi:hypothetical protein